MRLKALDQIHVSSVQPDSLRPGQEFDISDAAGAELLKANPTRLRQIDEPKAKAAATAENKAESPPLNKAEPDPNNKADKPPISAGKGGTPAKSGK